MASKLGFKGSLKLSTVCGELGVVKYKWYHIGIMLDIPRHKLEDFRKDEDPLAAVVDYWLRGNVEGVPVSWKTIIEVLKSDHVEEKGLAQRISRKYCEEDKCSDESASTYQESVITGATSTTSSGSSTFNLPAVDLAAYFPYLQDEKLSEEELITLEQKLDRNTTKIKLAFTDFVVGLQKHMEENTTAKHIITTLKILDNRMFGNVLLGCTSIIEIFLNITPYFSFFDFGIIKLLTKNFGSRSDEQKLKKYKKMFARFAKQRICECPKDAFGNAKESEKCFVMKIDKQIGEMTVNDLQKFKSKVSEILNCNLRLLSVEKGCIKLTFRIFEIINDMSADQKSMLATLGIIWVSYDEKTITLCESFATSGSLKIAKVTEKTYFEHEHSDSGVQTGSTNSSSGSQTATSSKSTMIIDKVKDLFDSRLDMVISAESEPKTLPFLCPLYVAIAKGNLKRVKELISKGENPMTTDINKNSCLHYAAALGELEILKYLIEDVECLLGTTGWRGRTILHFAAGTSNLSMVQYLVEDEHCRLDPTALDEGNNSVLHLACWGGDIKVVRFLIEFMTKEYYMEVKNVLYPESTPISKGKKLSLSDFIKNPLCCACYCGHLPLVKYFVEECGYNPTQITGRLPLESALLGRNLSVVKYLAKQSNFLLPGKQVVFFATRVSDLDLIKYLAKDLRYDFSERRDRYKSTPLHVACSLGKMDVIKYFLKSLKHDVNVKGVDGYQPIHIAAQAGQLEVVKYLVMEHSRNPNALNDYGITPLHLASSFGRMPVIKYLISEHNCDPLAVYSGTTGNSFDQAAAYGQVDVARYYVRLYKWNSIVKAKCVAQSLLIAAQQGQLNFVKFLIEELGCDCKARDINKNNVLHHAAMRGDVSLCKYLIEIQKYNANDVDQDEMNIVHLAAQCGQLELLKYFVEDLKMDVNVKSNPVRQDKVTAKPTPFEHAVQMGHLNVVKYCVEEHNCNLYNIDSIGDSVLHIAAANGHLDIVDYLIRNTSCHHLSQNNEGALPLHHAAFYGHIEVFSYLLKEKKSHSMVTDWRGHMPLHCAAAGGQLELLKYLVEKLKDSCYATNNNGSQPIHLAAQWGHLNIIEYLVISQKCDPNVSEGTGLMPIHLASLNGHIHIVRYLVENLKCDPNVEDAYWNRTPIQCAAKGGHLHVLKYFLNLDINPNVGHLSCLHLACGEGHLDIAKYLIEELKCSPAMKCSYDFAPIHMASSAGQTGVVKYLVFKHHIDPFSRNTQGYTPLHFAACLNQLDVVKFFAKEFSESVYIENDHGKTPLDLALSGGYRDTIALFLITVMFKLL